MPGLRLDAQNFGLDEFKAVGEDGQVEGYASLFGKADLMGDVVEPGAFTASLKKQKPKMLFGHDPMQVVGVWDEVAEDRRGLKVLGHLLPETTRGAEVLALLRAKALEGLSIGYKTIKATSNERGQRLLKKVDLWEISFVTFPMLPQAGVTRVKSQWTKTDVARALRDEGMPSAMATKLIAGGWDAANTQGARRNGGAIVDQLKRATQMMEMN